MTQYPYFWVSGKQGAVQIRIADPDLRYQLEDAMALVLPFVWVALTPGPRTFPDNAALVTLEKVSTDAKSDPREKFREVLDEALAKGLGVVALAVGPADLSEGARMLLLRDVTWPKFDCETVIKLLRATHSATGEVAEAELRTRLASTERITKLPWPVVNHACHAPTTLAVADRLAHMHAPANPTSLCTLDDVCGLPEVTCDLWRLVEDVRE